MPEMYLPATGQPGRGSGCDEESACSPERDEAKVAHVLDENHGRSKSDGHNPSRTEEHGCDETRDDFP